VIDVPETVHDHPPFVAVYADAESETWAIRPTVANKATIGWIFCFKPVKKDLIFIGTTLVIIK
jgi:hypothetical protein